MTDLDRRQLLDATDRITRLRDALDEAEKALISRCGGIHSCREVPIAPGSPVWECDLMVESALTRIREARGEAGTVDPWSVVAAIGREAVKATLDFEDSLEGIRQALDPPEESL